MQVNFRGAILTREEMATGLTQPDCQLFNQYTWAELANIPIPSRGCLLGQWGERSGDPLPDLLIVREEDQSDTLAWLSSFFSGMTPLTQWCRILTQSQAELIAARKQPINLGHRLALWVGATLAECSVQSDGAVNLRELPGSAALSSATYAAGRSAAIWGTSAPFQELARRHDELSGRLREGQRRVSAASLQALWYVLVGGELNSLRRDFDRSLEPFVRILDLAIRSGDGDAAELIQTVAVEATDHFDLPELADCARGPQSDRLRALDRLANRLSQGPQTPAIEGLLGLGASFVDPGAAVMPDLLRRHSARLPVAPIWMGAFAGAWAPIRVLHDQQGLGRIIAKALLANSDLEGRPAADIAFEEIIRWLAPNKSSQRVDIRGMAARTLSVEIMPGITSAFAYGRPETPTSYGSHRNDIARDEPRSTITAGMSHGGGRTRGDGRSLGELYELILSVTERVDRLERAGLHIQPSLNLPDPSEVRGKASRKPRER